jgi:kumamolisin
MPRQAKPHDTLAKVPGSEKFAPKAAKLLTKDSDQVIEVTIRVRRKKTIEPALKQSKLYSREQYEDEYGSSSGDIDLIEKFAIAHQLSVAAINSARRTVILRGKIKYFESAFRVHIAQYQDGNGHTFNGRTGAIYIPKNLEKVIEGVFGLDNRPIARPMFQIQKENGFVGARANIFSGFGSNEIARAYGFPKNVTGKGQCIGIIELGGGFRNADLAEYFSTLNVPAPAVKSISVDHSFNDPSTPDSDDGEVVLDIEVAGAVAPGAKIAVYFAPNTDQGFLDAITTAIHDHVNKPSVISISWGAAEFEWTQQSLKSYNEAFKAASLLGVTILAAAGDQGSADMKRNNRNFDGRVHADFPASSPFVLACGGTKVSIKNNKVTSEVVWNDAADSATGGGVSDVFDKPDYQSSTTIPLSIDHHFKGRGLPDIAGNASPDSGYKVLVDGLWTTIGGTSAVAPLMSGLIALLNEKKGSNVGFIHPTLYASSAKFCRDISKGDNITTPSNQGFHAKKGWDACTGWGVLHTL